MPFRMLISENDGLNEILSIARLELKKGPTAKRHPFRFAVLSSASSEKVSSRWVVFRKYTDEGKMLIYTDARSKKCEELSANPHCNLLFYHDRHKFQLRIQAVATLHHQDELTAKYWPGVKGSNPNDYLSIQAPGTPIKEKALGFERDMSLEDRHFVVLELAPQEMDVLQLNGDRHIRAQFQKEQAGWKSSFLVP